MRYTHLAFTPLTALAVVAAASVAAPFARAQASGSLSAALTAGTRVRVTVPGRIVSRRVGTIADMRGDTLVLRMDDREVALSAASIGQIEVSRGQRSRGEGALIGMTAGLPTGAVVGFGVAYATIGGRCAECDIVYPVFVSLGAVAGAVAGTVVGAANPGERWVRVPFRTRFGVAPRPGGGLALALTHRF
jgi:hypothetical protein